MILLLFSKGTVWNIRKLWSIPALGSNNTFKSRTLSGNEMLEMCNMIDDQECSKSGKYRNIEVSQIKNRECAVKKIMEAISHFTIP